MVIHGSLQRSHLTLANFNNKCVSGSFNAQDGLCDKFITWFMRQMCF